jgi:putative membrane protein
MATVAENIKTRLSESTDQAVRLILLLLFLLAQLFVDLPAWLNLIVFLLPVAFVILHSVRTFGGRDTLITLGTIFLIGYLFEAVGTNTGLIYGAYYYPESLNGPLLFGVPPLLPLIYVSVGYASYWIARLLLGRLKRLVWRDVLPLSIVAAFLMVLWDLAIDPTQSTVLSHYVWVNGGPYFGVPFQNFIGWFACCFIFFTLISVYFAGTSRNGGRIRATRGVLAEPILLYTIAAVAATMPLIRGDVTAISQSMTLVALFGMGLPIVVSILLLPNRSNS